MQGYVIIRFTGDISVYPGTLPFAGYSVSPESPGIAQEIKTWTLDGERLCRACCQVIHELEVKLGKEIPFDIKIQGDE